MNEKADTQAGNPQSISFTTFVLSLSTAALQHLGISLTEEEPECVPNLELAKQTIDILEMLETKTEGNLSDQEKKLLTNILYDLRMRYVKSAQTKSC